MIRTILIPVDFSSNSINAIHYALKINREFNAKIILFHSFIIPVFVTDVPLSVSDESEFRQRSIDELNRIKSRFQSVSPDTIFEVEMSTSLGSVGNEIAKAANEKQADLLVMGTKGAGAMRAMIVGTNTAEVIDGIRCPVLAIPEKANYKQWNKLVFATDYAASDAENIKEAVELAKLFHAEFILMHISTVDKNGDPERNYFQNYSDQVRKNVTYDKMSFEYLQNKDVLEGINGFLEASRPDVFFMSTHHRNLFQKIFNRSMTRAMLYQTQIPVCVFQA